jgi:MarR family multiple gene transcriptional regulator MgrA
MGEVPFAVDLHLALIRAYERAIHLNTRHSARWSLTPQQYNAIRILRFGDADGVRLSELGERLLQRVPDVSRLVDRLERAGLARRKGDPQDGRAVLVELTSKGRRLLEDMDADVMEAHERWYSALAPAEQRQLESLLRKATIALESAEP